MNSALGAYHPFYYTPLGNVCPVINPLVNVETINYGRCGPGVQQPECSRCCSKDGIRMTHPNFAGQHACLWDYGLACDGTQWPPGFNTSDTPRPKLGDVPYGTKIFNCKVENTLALTYDDGPREWTADLLDILKANGVKATFYIRTINLYWELIAHKFDERSALIRRIYKEGHQIAGHTWGHKDLDKMTPHQRRDEQIKAEIVLNDILGFFPTYMRPPFNICGPECQAEMGELGYHVTAADLDGRDWAGNYTYTEENFMEKIKGKNRNGVRAWLGLAHDTHEGTVHRYTQFMIDNARAHGYKLVRVGECLDDPEENWYRDPLTGDRPVEMPPRDMP